MSLAKKMLGLVWESDSQTQTTQQPNSAASSAVPAAIQQPAGAAQAPAATNKFVDVLRTSIRNRQTAFTALVTAADRLSNIIPDASTRLKAAFATIAGEGRDVRSIIQALDVHAADLDGQRMAFERQAEQAMKTTTGTWQAELDTIDPTIKSLQDQALALQQQIQSLSESITAKGSRKVELQNLLSVEQQRFEAARQEFNTALTLVKSELDGQRAIIQSALS